jgi:hypothetical protein
MQAERNALQPGFVVEIPAPIIPKLREDYVTYWASDGPRQDDGVGWAERDEREHQEFERLLEQLPARLPDDATTVRVEIGHEAAGNLMHAWESGYLLELYTGSLLGAASPVERVQAADVLLSLALFVNCVQAAREALS